MFDALLKIGYGSDLKKSYARLTPEQKETKKKRIAEVKEAFKRRLGLKVDQPRDGGAGSTTTGNVVRRAFENAGKYLSQYQGETLPN